MLCQSSFIKVDHCFCKLSGGKERYYVFASVCRVAASKLLAIQVILYIEDKET